MHKYANKDALDLFTLTLFQMFIFGWTIILTMVNSNV